MSKLKIGKAISRAFTLPKEVRDSIAQELKGVTFDDIKDKEAIKGTLTDIVMNVVSDVALPTNSSSGWKSRKLWVAIISIVAITINNLTGAKIDENTMWQILAIAAAYIGVEGIADIKKTT